MVFDTLTLRFSRFVNRTPSHSAFFSYICTHFILAHMHLHGVARRVFIKERPSTCHRVCDRALSLHPLTSSSLSSASTHSLISSPPLSWSSSSMWSLLAIHNPLTGYEPNQLDNLTFSETFEAIFQNESVDVDTEPSYSCDAELDDELVGKALSSPLFIQEREEPANLRQTYHSHEESLLPAQSFFTRASTGRPVYEPSSALSQKRKSSRDLDNEQIRILFERQEEQILAEVRSEIQKHELQAESDKRSIQELIGIIDSQRMEVDHTIAGCDQSRRGQFLIEEELSEHNRALRETRIRNVRDMEELQKFTCQRSRNFQEEN